MHFKVTATKEVWADPPRNPFRVPIDGNFGPLRVITRTWEFEAENEEEVRKLWADAQNQCLDNVAGFNLGRIEALPTPAKPPEVGSHR